MIEEFCAGPNIQTFIDLRSVRAAHRYEHDASQTVVLFDGLGTAILLNIDLDAFVVRWRLSAQVASKP